MALSVMNRGAPQLLSEFLAGSSSSGSSTLGLEVAPQSRASHCASSHGGRKRASQNVPSIRAMTASMDRKATTSPSPSSPVPNSFSRGQDVRSAFKQMSEILREISHLDSVQSLLFWDQQVMMPRSAAAARGGQLSALARVLHREKTNPELGKCLDILLSAGNLVLDHGFDEYEAAAVREAGRDYFRAMKMPPSLEARAAELGSRAMVAWQQAKGDEDFEKFAPALQEWVDILQKMGQCVEPTWGVYDYCVDKFERGMTGEKLNAIFDQTKAPLIELVRKIKEANRTPDQAFLQSMDLFSGQFSLETQKRMARRLAHEIGFSFDAGRLDESAHPFMSGIASPWDVRITSRYTDSEFASGIRTVLHEAGHGLYEQGRSEVLTQRGLPVARPISLGMHESQSLIWERMVGMGAEYWAHYWPIVLRNYSSLPRSKSEQFYSVINQVQPSLIRVDADEVTYPLHVLLRYEIERKLLNGDLEVSQIPETWDSKMEEYLGVVPTKPSEGCLQDIHWAAGAIGYFPTYAIGAIYACQLFEAAEMDMPSLREDLSEGKFSGLRSWLKSRVHEVGSLYGSAEEVMEAVTGKRIDAACFLNYLSRKYSDLYKLE